MNKASNSIWKETAPQQLAEVICRIGDKNNLENFLSDVMTNKEIIEISSRLEAARLLSDGVKYTDITRQTKLSSRTVARISQWIKNGYGGYLLAIDIINNHHLHIQPDSAD